ncbi:MAG: acyltransferase [Muribaculaceae bacterium]|nr:acyltransferase [Muribaculaceae bacterium]
MNSFCDIRISRKDSEHIRGIAILLIMLHNLCHIFPRVVTENEFTYNPALNDLFISHVKTGNPLSGYDFLSFLGWYGVPVFVFLSGYGLAVKYGMMATRLRLSFFMMRSWRKLLLLMIPGVAAFLLEELLHSGIPSAESSRLFAGILIPLTGLNDVVQPWLPTVPGVYWYFGLTLELYFVYAVLIHGRPLWPAVVATTLCYLLVATCAATGHTQATEYLRHNFTGWLLPFLMGTMWARRKECRKVMAVVLMTASAFLFFPIQLNALTWQGASVPAVILIVCGAWGVKRVPGVSQGLAFIGRLSPFLFVSHPITRHILGRYLLDFSSPGATPTLFILGLYLTLSILTAICYRYAWDRLFRICMRSIGSGAPNT